MFLPTFFSFNKDLPEKVVTKIISEGTLEGHNIELAKSTRIFLGKDFPYLRERFYNLISLWFDEQTLRYIKKGPKGRYNWMKIKLRRFFYYY